jgi:predicted transcriptional regulator
MAEHDTPPPGIDLDRVARIVGSYVRHHQIGSDQLAGLIGEVHRALASLGRSTPVEEPLMPAVPIRRSVQPDHVVCLECRYHAQMLRRHLRVAHDLEAADYRMRWKLSADYPLTAPNYSARRSAMAKEIGLGRKPQGRRVVTRSGDTAPKAARAQTAIGCRGVVRARLSEECTESLPLGPLPSDYV